MNLYDLSQSPGRTAGKKVLMTDQKHIRMHNLWVPESDSKVLERYSAAHGLLNLDISKIAKAVKLCKQRARALDIGAHIGAISVFLSRHFANVSAFEAIPQTFETLLMNVSDLENVQAFNLAISSDSSDLFFSHFQTHGQLSHVETALDTRKTERVGPIKAATIDSFAYDDVSFIKIDVEGYELPVLTGAQATILRCRPVILMEQAGNEEKHFGRKRNEASEFLEGLGLALDPNFPEKFQKDRCFRFLDN
jgi:FkbM family methyltransferase